MRHRLSAGRVAGKEGGRYNRPTCTPSFLPSAPRISLAGRPRPMAKRRLRSLFMAPMGALVVKRRYSPRTKLLIVGGLIAGTLASAAFIYEFGVNNAGFERNMASVREDSLREDLKKLRDENLELREMLARAQRTLQMDQIAYQELDQTLTNNARELTKQREELNFYRNIVSPANKVSGLQIQGLNVERSGDANVFRYRLVLVQALKHERTVYGRAVIDVTGLRDGVEATLQYPQANDKPLTVNFKYFQDFTGTMRLPANFQPVRIRAHVTQSGGDPVEQTFDWPKL